MIHHYVNFPKFIIHFFTKLCLWNGSFKNYVHTCYWRYLQNNTKWNTGQCIDRLDKIQWIRWCIFELYSHWRWDMGVVWNPWIKVIVYRLKAHFIINHGWNSSRHFLLGSGRLLALMLHNTGEVVWHVYLGDCADSWECPFIHSLLQHWKQLNHLPYSKY